MLNISGKIKGVLGKGNFWTIKEVEADAPIAIEGENYKNVACKFSNRKNRADIGNNLRIYHSIKKAGLPTLHFLEYGLFKHEECLVAENFNNRPNTLYVSPNTPTENPNPILLALSNRPNNYIPSINEKFLSDHKIEELVKFEEFLNLLKRIVYVATLGKVGLCPDALFFGVSKRSYNQLTDCIIADFDAIMIINDDDDDFDDLFKRNLDEVLTALKEFAWKFIAENKRQKYLDDISSWSNGK